MKEHGTQKQRLLQYLQENETINPLEAWTELGIYRLGVRIFDLKKDGWTIVAGETPVKNRFGEDCYVAEYSLKPHQPIPCAGKTLTEVFAEEESHNELNELIQMDMGLF